MSIATWLDDSVNVQWLVCQRTYIIITGNRKVPRYNTHPHLATIHTTYTALQATSWLFMISHCLTAASNQAPSTSAIPCSAVGLRTFHSCVPVGKNHGSPHTTLTPTPHAVVRLLVDNQPFACFWLQPLACCGWRPANRDSRLCRRECFGVGLRGGGWKGADCTAAPALPLPVIYLERRLSPSSALPRPLQSKERTSV